MNGVRFVTRKWPPAVGGMETYCLRLVEHLRGLLPVEVWPLPGRPDGSPPRTSSLVRYGIVTFLRLLTGPAAPIVHVADLASWPLAWAASIRSRQTVIVISAHGSDVSYSRRASWRGRLYRAYLRMGSVLLRRAKVIANSNYIAGLAAEVGFGDVTTIYMGTDFSPPPGPGSEHGDLLFAGRISAGKGLRFLVEEVLPKLHPPVRLRVAGTVWDESEAALLRLPQVVWLGELSAQDLAREYAACLAVVVPSKYVEGFGLVAVEAAACGSVVIAADHSGLAEAVTPEIGFLVESGNAAAWASRIQSVRRWSERERQRFIARSSSLARRTYSWERVARETTELYRHARASTQAGSSCPSRPISEPPL